MGFTNLKNAIRHDFYKGFVKPYFISPLLLGLPTNDIVIDL